MDPQKALREKKSVGRLYASGSTKRRTKMRVSRYAVQKLLEDAGFQVQLQTTARQASRSFELGGHNFIWMDWRLPGMDGDRADR